MPCNYDTGYMMQHTMVPNEMKGIFRSILVVIMIGLTLAGCETGDGETIALNVAAERTAIQEVLMRQQDAWNAGDIEAFMDDYVKSDTLRFTSGATVRYGWDAALDRYYTTYPDRGAMGQMTFSDLAIDVHSEEWATVFGSWHLKRGGAYADIGGRYTLLMHHGTEGWKVLYDHTSQADS